MKASRKQDCCKTPEIESALIEGVKEPDVFKNAGFSKSACDDCAQILHGLNNVLASMLLNAQVMEWKLPSYSRSRRYLHEIERNAQRGGELVKRLLERLDAECQIGGQENQAGAESSVLPANEALPAQPAEPTDLFPMRAGVDPGPEYGLAP